MADFNPASTFANARRVAGNSDARQIRDAKYGSNITYAKTRFLSMFGTAVPGEDGKVKGMTPEIETRNTTTLTPEIYDSEVAPTTVTILADTAAIGVGDSATITLNTTAGFEPGVILNHPSLGAAARITAVAGNTATITVISSSGGAVVWPAAASQTIEVLNMASGDAPTVGVGTNRDRIQRTNNLQFSFKGLSQGILQKHLALYGNQGGDAPNQEFLQEKRLQLVDFQRRREMQMLMSQEATSTGTGDTRIMYSKGMIGWAGAVVPNLNPDGGIDYATLMNTTMAAARETGGGFEVWGLGVSTALQTLLLDKTIRMTTVTDKFKVNYQKFELPGGILNLVLCDAFDTSVRAGQMLTFHSDDVYRYVLKGLDLQYQEGLELNNVLGERAAFMVCEALMASNPGGIKLHTNILKAA
jgi:hypothetical protein